MAPPLTRSSLRRQNLAFIGTGGVSFENRCRRFEPAFRDAVTGRVERARFADGSPAPMHVIEGLPAEWAESEDCQGRVAALKPTIVAGFVRDGVFYTREEAADQCAQS